MPTIDSLRSDGLQSAGANSVDVQAVSHDGRVALIGERQPGEPGHRLAVAQQAQQDRGRRQPRGVVERAVDGIEHPHQGRIDRRTAELLAVHADSGRLLQRLDHLAFDGEVDLGGEVVALLGDRGLRAVPDDERLGRRVEDRRWPRRPAPRDRRRPDAIPALPTHRGERLGKRESPGVQRLSDDRALDAERRSGSRSPAGRRGSTPRRRR